jgi:CubicO group peptidase (beta-lactamase class C family)
MGLNLESVLEDLETDAASQIFELGSQVYVEQGGVVLADTAFGVDALQRRMTTTTLHTIYCASKPFLAVTLAVMASQGELLLKTRVREVLSGLPSTLGDLTIDQILSHRAGLFVYPPEMFGLVPKSERLEVIISGSQKVRPREGSTYAEFAGWYLLELIIESITKVPLRSVIQECIINPLGLDRDIFLGFDADSWRQNQDRLGCNCDMNAPYPIPLLMEINESVCSDIRAANGIYASMSGLGRFYAALGRILKGSDALPGLTSETLRHFVVPAAPPDYDIILKRNCTFGRGFMVRLSEHQFGRACSTSSFGHGGFEGLTFGFCDPECDLSVALHHNGIIDGSLALGKRRAARVESIYGLQLK